MVYRDGTITTITLVTDVLTGKTVKTFGSPYNEEYNKFYKERDCNKKYGKQ
jgi:hypothetical protein